MPLKIIFRLVCRYRQYKQGVSLLMPLENLEGIVLNIVPETNPFGSGEADRIVTHAHQKLLGQIVHDDQISYSDFAQDYVTRKNWPNPAFGYVNFLCDRL